MGSLEDRALRAVRDTVQNVAAVESMLGQVSEATEAILDSLGRQGKIMVFGNGGSAAQSQHFAAELMGTVSPDHSPIPAVALSSDTSVLTAVSNDYDFDAVFLKQVEGLAKPEDVLVALSTSGNSNNVNRALSAAQRIGCTRVGLMGGDGGLMRALCDVALVFPGASSSRVQECHLVALHIMADLIIAASRDW